MAFIKNMLLLFCQSFLKLHLKTEFRHYNVHHENGYLFWILHLAVLLNIKNSLSIRFAHSKNVSGCNCNC